MRLPVETLAGLSLAALLASCGHAADGRAIAISNAAPDQIAGPAADYPVVLGAPFAVDGITYAPANTLNYDQVGHAVVDDGGAAGVSLAHRTLPLPSYVEVTSLLTGKTILARVERRGPMAGSSLVALSPGAAAQLGMAGPHEAVRVRRVNPPEAERALLRQGQRAPERMSTPMSLVAVLARKLVQATPAPAPGPASSAAEILSLPPVPKTAAPARPAPRANPATAPKSTGHPDAAELFAVQVGAFSTASRAAQVASRVGGVVSTAGKLHRVRISGFASAADAQGALAKARAAGYSDARIQRVN